MLDIANFIEFVLHCNIQCGFKSPMDVFGVASSLLVPMQVIKKPINQHQSLENVTIALKAIADDNVRLVPIGEWILIRGCGYAPSPDGPPSAAGGSGELRPNLSL